MYPTQELKRLLAHKASLCGEIGRRRDQVATSTRQALEPLQWVDSFLALTQRLRPLLELSAFPLGVFLARHLFPKTKALGLAIKWGPILLGFSKAAKNVWNSATTKA